MVVGKNDVIFLGFTFNVGGFFTKSVDGVQWGNPIQVHDGGWGAWDYGTIVSVDAEGDLLALYHAAYGWADPPYNIYLKEFSDSRVKNQFQITNFPNNQPGPPPGYDYSGYYMGDVAAGPDGAVYVTYWWMAYYQRPYYPSQKIPGDFDRLYFYDLSNDLLFDLSIPNADTRGGEMAIDASGKVHIVFRSVGAGPPPTPWFETIGGKRREYANDIAAGSLFVTGSTRSFRVRGWDAFVAKFASDGSLEYFKTFGGRRHDIALAIEKGSGLYVGGVTNSFGVKRQAGFVAFYDETENVFNLKLVDTRGRDRVNDLAVHSSEGQEYVYAVGLINGRGRRGDAFLAKFNGQGGLLWARVFGGRFFDEALGVTIGDDGNIYVAGITGSPRRSDIFVAKFAPDGTMLWAKGLRTKWPEVLKGITADANGIYLTGICVFKRTNFKAFVMKLSYLGTLDWFVIFDAGRMVDVGGVAAEGAIYLTGSLRLKTHQIYVAKLNPDGSLAYYKVFRALGRNEGRGISLDSNGNPYIAGSTSYGSRRGSVFLAMVPPDPAAGSYEWTAGERWPLEIVDITGSITLKNILGINLQLLNWEVSNVLQLSSVSVMPKDRAPEEHRAELGT